MRVVVIDIHNEHKLKKCCVITFSYAAFVAEFDKNYFLACVCWCISITTAPMALKIPVLNLLTPIIALVNCFWL